MLVWIVGSLGMLGRELVRLCSQENIPYFATDRQECDITDLETCRTRAQAFLPTHIINCAAYTDVDRAEVERAEAIAVNAQGPLHLALVAEELGAKLIHISTDYVFNGEGKRPYLETDLCDPINVYGQSKWEGEKNVLAHAPGACVVRTSWLFGIEGNNFLSSLLRWLQEKEEVKIVADQVNRPTYVVDLAKAVLSLFEEEGIFHFANGSPISRFEIAQDVLAQARQRGIEIKCQRLVPVASDAFPSLAKRPLYTALDTMKFALAVKAPRPWQEIVNDYLEHNRCNVKKFS